MGKVGNVELILSLSFLSSDSCVVLVAVGQGGVRMRVGRWRCRWQGLAEQLFPAEPRSVHSRGLLTGGGQAQGRGEGEHLFFLQTRDQGAAPRPAHAPSLTSGDKISPAPTIFCLIME